MTARYYAPVTASRISLPPPPQELARRQFPLLASAAPVAGALVMWAFTQSPFALALAFLGPLIAIASMVDDRRLTRREAAAERARFRRGIDLTLTNIAAAHSREREQLVQAALAPEALLRSVVRDPEWWRDAWDKPILICLGLASVASALELDPRPDLPLAAGGEEVGEAYDRLHTAAATVTNAPVLVDAREGIGIVGTPVLARAVARSVAVQLAFRLSPAATTISLHSGGEFDWAARLPHPRQAAVDEGRIEFRMTGSGHGPPRPGEPGRAVCAVASDPAELPRDCRVILRLDDTGKALLERNRLGPRIDQLIPWFLSASQGSALVDMAATCAAADGLVPRVGALPDSLALSALQPAEPARGRLAAVFSSGLDGPITLDLVDHGPHAVIGGTTGSGKSELLISWVLALATTCSPAEVNFLLVDFKGGSSFAAVSLLPHTVGVITDLDQTSAGRALASLRAELRHRERVSASAGVRSIDELEGNQRLPRLVIVVDEFAVLADEFPELQALFADLAARGRSLGIHLILCTQRPAGVIRDSVMANCSIRISLRVNNGADSSAVIGTTIAAELPPKPDGRCYLSVGGSAPFVAQIGLAAADDTEAARIRWSELNYRARRPWCEPLPPVVLPSQVGAPQEPAGIAFALSDVPEEQSQPTAVYDPDRDGNVIVFGGHGSGKSGVLAALAAATRLADTGCRAVRIPDDVEGAWDAVGSALAQLAEPDADPKLYLLDDADALIGRFADDHRLVFAERVARLLREGPGRGSRVVLTAARLSSSIQSLVSLCDSRLLLRMPNRQEHMLASADGQPYVAQLPAGGGFWRGHRVQVMLCPPDNVPVPLRRELPTTAGEGIALVVADPRGAAERIRAHGLGNALPAPDVTLISNHPGNGELTVTTGGHGNVVVGSPTDWQSQWALFASVRASRPVVFAGCSAADFRMLTGSRTIPPPLGAALGGAWMLTPDGSVTRVQLPKNLTT